MRLGQPPSRMVCGCLARLLTAWSSEAPISKPHSQRNARFSVRSPSHGSVDLSPRSMPRSDCSSWRLKSIPWGGLSEAATPGRPGTRLDAFFRKPSAVHLREPAEPWALRNPI